jgi:hypothetical protein
MMWAIFLICASIPWLVTAVMALDPAVSFLTPINVVGSSLATVVLFRFLKG